MYLLDTNVFIDFLSRKPFPGLRSRMGALRTGEYNTSSIVLMELRRGTARDLNPAATWTSVVSRLFSNLTVLDFTQKEALLAADIDFALEKHGRTLPEIDLMVGVTALSHGLTLVTDNVRDYADIPGLKIENWRRP